MLLFLSLWEEEVKVQKAPNIQCFHMIPEKLEKKANKRSKEFGFLWSRFCLKIKKEHPTLDLICDTTF